MFRLKRENPAPTTVAPAKPARWPSIRRPNAIQNYGLMLVLDEALRVRRVSENARERLGLEPAVLLGGPVETALGAAAKAQIEEALAAPNLEHANPLELDTRAGAFEGVLSRLEGEGLVLELFPRQPDNASMNHFYTTFRRAMDQLPLVDSLDELARVAARELRRLTGYDRVMVYKFSPDWHGQVIAEDVREDLGSFLHLHFPASDIPPEARQVYHYNRVRMINDVDGGWCSLAQLEGADPAWDMAPCILRATHPGHLQYLRNMGSQATFTVSLFVEDQLWGLIACHHLTPKHLPYHVRAAAELFGRLFSLQVQNLDAKEHAALQSRLAELSARLVSAMSVADHPAYAAVADDTILQLVRADSVAIRLEGQYYTRGVPPAREDVEAVAARLLAREPGAAFGSPAAQLVATDDALPEHPELFLYRKRASGMLFLPLSRPGGDFIMWFRREILQDVQWAGEPPKPGETQTPRASFAAWRQDVYGHSLPWLRAEMAAANELTRSVPELLLRRAQARLAHLALHDPLSGLPSRTYLTQVIQPRVDAAGWQGALLFVDFDRFKLVNDTLGHEAGDEVLRQLSARFGEVLGAGQQAVRLGGDEFLVVCEGTAAREAEALAWRLSEAFRRPLRIGEVEYFISASIGIAEAEPRPEGGADLDELMRRADAAMYAAKRAGRNSVTVYDPALGSLEGRAAEIEQALRRALIRGEFQVYFQPILRPEGAVAGAEALLRWNSPELGWVSPGEFIPIAEESGSIGQLGRWVLDRVLAQMSEWDRTRPELRSLPASVNLSVKQLSEPDLFSSIEQALDRYGIEPGRLKLEVTETSLMENPELSRELLVQLSRKGVRLSIDDFGTGFSSLSYVRALPVHELKIDKSFLQDSGDKNHTVLASIIRLAHELGLQAVAEGVETEPERAMLRELGCDLLQGYLFSRPVPPEQFAEFYLRQTAARA